MAWALLGGGPHGRAETAAPAPGETPLVDAAAIAGWIDDLDNDRYAVREAAHYRLVAAGSAALLDVGQAAAGGVLESSTRAVNILLQWAQSDDGALSLGALEQLAALTNRPVEARMASERLAAVREADALRKIAQLGGRFPFDPMTAVISGAGANAPLQVIIGPEWTGGVEGLAHIADVPRAITVSFHSAPIGDQAIAQLTKLTQLQRIEFYGTPVSPEALAELAQGLPQAVVEIRGGARLGIAGMPGAGGAAVQAVQSGSAAERAGLLPGDVITQIDGVTVADFEALTREIAKAKAGDSVVLQVLRQGTQAGQTMDVTVTFDQWGAEPPGTTPAPGNPTPIRAVPFGPVPIGVPPAAGNRR